MGFLLMIIFFILYLRGIFFFFNVHVCLCLGLIRKRFKFRLVARCLTCKLVTGRGGWLERGRGFESRQSSCFFFFAFSQIDVSRAAYTRMHRVRYCFTSGLLGKRYLPTECFGFTSARFIRPLEKRKKEKKEQSTQSSANEKKKKKKKKI